MLSDERVGKFLTDHVHFSVLLFGYRTYMLNDRFDIIVSVHIVKFAFRGRWACTSQVRDSMPMILYLFDSR